MLRGVQKSALLLMRLNASLHLAELNCGIKRKSWSQPGVRKCSAPGLRPVLCSLPGDSVFFLLSAFKICIIFFYHKCDSLILSDAGVWL